MFNARRLIYLLVSLNVILIISLIMYHPLTTPKDAQADPVCVPVGRPTIQEFPLACPGDGCTTSSDIEGRWDYCALTKIDFNQDDANGIKAWVHDLGGGVWRMDLRCYDDDGAPCAMSARCLHW